MSESSHFTSIRKLRWGIILASLMVGCALARVAAADVPEQNLEQDGAGTAATEPKSVNVVTRRDGQDTHFFVENKEYGEVTMTFEMGLVNLQGDVEFPFTLTFPPRQTTEAFTLSPINPSAKWSFDYTNYYKLGSNIARHDDSYVYELPYQPGTHHRVTQGYNGKFSHTGSNQYAIDWQMPEGTLVCAARGGIVVRVKDDSDRGGSSMAFDRFNNYVLIRHSDGTMGHYCHLQKDGVLVKVGETVFAGQPIAHSGNTGFSSGPHLHFCVFKTKNGRERVSLPTRFRTAEDEAITLVSGRNYRAVGVETASAPVTFGGASARGAAGQ
ncbi:MAG TPA: M23 family metallopeptidase [Verrucomicrobiae bacterium]|nr:M23 family metallopeptidase [Verrucomicrobiae bacterium]